MELTDNLLSRGKAETVYAWNPIDIMNVYALPICITQHATELYLLKRSKSLMPYEEIPMPAIIKTSQTKG